MLAVAKALLPGTLTFLPLGGSAIAEIGIAVAAATIADPGRQKDD